ncbi:hypothetical protein CVT26_002506 [Gymnopilus dilepis]|uniref:CxC2-like cysteine cluster KDZ transposase-associated domain-containing protein n=1 Tax=Gymnopilus dilepis TaxID=231916 RepID=A0A409YN87_9AGAR|nr:hypothetical protein CVT26_002506 [Gymnopilus dilepis]
MSRPSKRARTAAEGGSTRDILPLATDAYYDIHEREIRIRRTGLNTTASVPTAPFIQKTEEAWIAATSSWAPLDDPEYALDPDGLWYDDILDQDPLKEGQAVKTDDSPKKKRKRSEVSRRPHIVWKRTHRPSYLDEVCRFSGRGDFIAASQCPDCIARKAMTPGIPEYRCVECFLPDLTCRDCCVRRHRMNPLHRIQLTPSQQWSGSHFEPISLKSLGLQIQLNHSSMYCVNPQPCHASMLVLHTNGIHQVSINFCGCDRALPQHTQLLRRRLYPASQRIVKTCATFELLDLLHKFALSTKSSTYDFYNSLEKMTDNTGLRTPKSRYRSLFRMVLQWRHLKLLKWGGRAHDPAGIEATAPGELALQCPSCPHPGINLPDGWEEVPADEGYVVSKALVAPTLIDKKRRYIYMKFVCMDANFRLKNQLVSSYSQDPGFGIGWAYMVPREPYEAFIRSRTNDQDISTCVGFQALAQANTRFSQGLRTTGQGGAFCGRSEMILPLGMGNLQKGERYANMDYVFASSIRGCKLPRVLISYDIACQWFKNLADRMQENWPPDLDLPPSTKLIPAIPKLHEPMHNTPNHEVYSLNLIPGVGLSDLETPERVWSAHNALGNSTKTQGPGSRQDVLDDHFGHWNWQKIIGLGKTLMRRYRNAVADRNIQKEGHRGLTASLDAKQVENWEKMCVDWEQDAFPKKKKNPYETEGAVITEAQAKKELAAEEAKRLKMGGAVLHATSAYAFVVMALEIEESQRRLRRVAKQVESQATTRKEANLTEQRNQLTARIRAWEQLVPIYMPGLLQYQIERQAAGEDVFTVAEHSELIQLWLPSRLPASYRPQVCSNDLPEIEDRLRTAQCHDALRAIRYILKIKTRLIKFKHKNLRGQREGTRSRAVIDRVHEKARVGAEKYRASRTAKLSLIGPGEWEKELQVLRDEDVRGYQDPDRLRKYQGRRGTLEDHQLEAEQSRASSSTMPNETDDFTLFREERTRRDGTGETRRTLSWIWRTGKVVDDPDNATDDILRAEWAKSRARAARAEEEVKLLQEEMRRTYEYLKWKSKEWLSQATRRSVDQALAEAFAAYAQSQSSLYSLLADRFYSTWQSPLEDATEPTPATLSTPPAPLEPSPTNPALTPSPGPSEAVSQPMPTEVRTANDMDTTADEHELSAPGSEGDRGDGEEDEEDEDEDDEDNEREDYVEFGYDDELEEL